MFQLTKDEYENMSSQFVTTSPQKRPKSAVPYAFTDKLKTATPRSSFFFLPLIWDISRFLLILLPKLTFSNECRSKTCISQKFSVPLRENRADRKKISCYTTLCGFIIGQLRVQKKEAE